MLCLYYLHHVKGLRDALRLEPIMVFLKQIIIICNFPNDFLQTNTYME
jgi:hypothetical protein